MKHPFFEKYGRQVPDIINQVTQAARRQLLLELKSGFDFTFGK